MAGFRSLYRYRGNLESDEILFSAKNGETITEAMVNSPYPELDVQGSLSFYWPRAPNCIYLEHSTLETAKAEVEELVPN